MNNRYAFALAITFFKTPHTRQEAYRGLGPSQIQHQRTGRYNPPTKKQVSAQEQVVLPLVDIFIGNLLML